MRRKHWILILVLISCLLFTHSVLAMSSPSYTIDWLVPLSGGGSSASSANYSVQLTIGQTAIGISESAGYQAGWGFWNGFREMVWDLFLPLVENE